MKGLNGARAETAAPKPLNVLIKTATANSMSKNAQPPARHFKKTAAAEKDDPAEKAKDDPTVKVKDDPATSGLRRRKP